MEQTDKYEAAKMPLTQEIANTSFMNAQHLGQIIRESQVRVSHKSDNNANLHGKAIAIVHICLFLLFITLQGGRFYNHDSAQNSGALSIKK